MRRETKGRFVFLGAAALAAALYGLTRPEGLPWGVGTAAMFGATAAKGLAALPGAWCWAVCAVAAGLLGAVVSRYLGWRVGLAAALAWIFLPKVWNGAVLGEPIVLYASAGIAGLWFLNVILVGVMETVSQGRRDGREHGRGTVSGGGRFRQRLRVNYLASLVILGAAAVFAIGSLCLHDYRLGEAASVYARGVVEEAGERIIVLNGVVDEQVEREVEGGRLKVGQRNGPALYAISPDRTDEAYALEVYDWVRREWPDDEALVALARCKVQDFLTLALDRHPERFYLMNGESTTPEQWNRRWERFVPYLDSSDRFVPVARRYFAYEANAVANRLQDTDEAAAWRLYGRVLDEVDPGNIAALVNRKAMVIAGYPATTPEMVAIDHAIAEFLGDAYRRDHALGLLQAAGPVRRDTGFLSALEATHRWISQTDGVAEVPQEVERMIDLNNAMVKAREAGDKETSECLARRILANPFWRNWAPANAVMGDLMAVQGDYAAAEAYYRIATAGHLETPRLVWNNYADALMRLGKLDEAETILRRQIAETDDAFFLPRFTLAELLTKKGGSKEEVMALIDAVMKNAPEEYRRTLREAQEKGEMPK